MTIRALFSLGFLGSVALGFVAACGDSGGNVSFSTNGEGVPAGSSSTAFDGGTTRGGSSGSVASSSGGSAPNAGRDAAAMADASGASAGHDAAALTDGSSTAVHDGSGGTAAGHDGSSETSGDAGVVTADAASPNDSQDAALAGWTLTWSDEFDGPDGSAVDPTKWTYDVGGTGWGNDELEYYTQGTANAVVEGGNLVITATPQNASQYSCWYGTCQYTSARLLTQGLFSQEYGRFEARVLMPTGQGLWPAVWLLGNDINTAGWPACGEIDFMETIGSDITTNHGSLHMPNNYGPTGTYTLPGGASFGDAFHTFAIQWEPGTIDFFVDDQLYETQTQASVPAGDTWEFDQPFFLIINVAVGGTWPGSPDSTTVFPQTMKVDWIRVYQKSSNDP